MVDNIMLSHMSSFNVSTPCVFLLGVTAAPTAATAHGQSSCSDTSRSNKPSSRGWMWLRNKNYLIFTFNPFQVMDENRIFKGYYTGK